MDNLKVKYLERIQHLLGKADDAKSTYRGTGVGTARFFTLSFKEYFEWVSGCKSLLESVVGKEDHFYQDFVGVTSRVANRPAVNAGVGILNALKEDIELGLLANVQTLALAEVFNDFLEMAEHFLDSGHKDPAAFLVGAVLEDGLKKLATKNCIPLEPQNDISAVNMKLADKKIYNKLTQSQIETWKKIRNSAAHGKFDEYDKKEVKDFLVWTRDFLEKHLS